ncbi:MAG: hypothetical protein ACK56F_03610, partial [bacterium]
MFTRRPTKESTENFSITKLEAISDEKKTALLKEIYSDRPSSNPLPPEVLYFSSVFDWEDPE